MTDRKEQHTTPQPPNKKRNFFLIGLFGILIVLLIANLDAILKPIDALNAILTPIMIGLVIAYICNPVLRFCEIKIFFRIKKRTVNRALSMILTYVFVLLILAGVVWLIIPNVITSFNDFTTKGYDHINNLIGSLNEWIAALPFDLPGAEGEGLISLNKILNYGMSLISSYGSVLAGEIGSIIGSAITVLKNILVGIFVSIYVLLSKDRLNAGCRRIVHALFSSTNEEKILHYTSQANQKFGGFLVGKMVDSLLVGVTCAILFTIFQIPYPILIAVIIGITDFIPFFGPFIGAIPSALIIFIISPGKAILFVLLILVVQQIDGNLIAPMILGDHTGLTSLGVLIAITLFGGLFGFIGMLLGVPLFALITVILDDYIKYRLNKKGSPTDLYSYYPADAFIKPSPEEEEHLTMSQRFMQWVSAVETDAVPGENGKPKKNRFNIAFRRVCLHFGLLLRRIFSIKPIPEDQSGTVFANTRKRGIPANRSFWRTFLFSILTILIYPIYQLNLIAQSTNIACKRDGKRTWGFIPMFICSILTLGIFYVIWHCQVIRRYREYCIRNGEEPVASVKYYALWTLLGAPILVGPFIGIAKFLKAFNQTATIFNRTHTFPITDEVFAEEAAEGAAMHAARKANKLTVQEVLIGTMPDVDPDEPTLEELNEMASLAIASEALHTNDKDQ